MIKVDRNVMFSRLRKSVMFESVLQLFYMVMNACYVRVYTMYNSSALT